MELKDCNYYVCEYKCKKCKAEFAMDFDINGLQCEPSVLADIQCPVCETLNKVELISEIHGKKTTVDQEIYNFLKKKRTDRRKKGRSRS